MNPNSFSLRGVVALLAIVIWATVAWRLWDDGQRLVPLFAIGTSIGYTLYRARFGFGAAYRRLLLDRQTEAVSAQLLMIAVATLLFAPLLAHADGSYTGAWAPAGVQVAVGAFLFGIGMQLGGGCGSGTLYTAGGGSLRMWLVLSAFCGGSFFATEHLGWWQQLPGQSTRVLGQLLGWWPATLLQVGLLALLFAGLQRWRRPAPKQSPYQPGRTLLAAAVMLALLNLATLLVAGHPWTITWAFSLWGAKAATLVGWEPASGGFWAGDFQAQALQSPILEDQTSVMNIGIVLGAAGAAIWHRGKVTLGGNQPRQWIAALIGGLIMGYGARIAYGCNIGAFFSGIASGSLHGWLWIALALPGNWVGIGLRPWFGLSNSAPVDGRSP